MPRQQEARRPARRRDAPGARRGRRSKGGATPAAAAEDPRAFSTISAQQLRDLLGIGSQAAPEQRRRRPSPPVRRVASPVRAAESRASPVRPPRREAPKDAPGEQPPLYPDHAPVDACSPRDPPPVHHAVVDAVDGTLQPALSARPAYDAGGYAANKWRSIRGCAQVADDENEKRARQQSILRQQIEERKRIKAREAEAQARLEREEDERIQHEIAVLQQRWDREREQERLAQERKQVRIQNASSSYPKPVNGPSSRAPAVERSGAADMHAATSASRHQSARSSPDDRPGAIRTGTTHPDRTESSAHRDGWPDTRAGPIEAVPGRPAVSFKKQAKDNPDVEGLSRLCAQLMLEQEHLRRELSLQRVQAELEARERSKNDELTQQVQDLQAQLRSLTAPDRARERVRQHRKKVQTTSPGKPNSTFSPPLSAKPPMNPAVPGQPRPRRRGSWATRSKAGAPAPRASVSLAAHRAKPAPSPDAVEDLGEELGSSTRMIYPGDALYGAVPPAIPDTAQHLLSCNAARREGSPASLPHTHEGRAVSERIRPKLKPVLARRRPT